ncbi:ABC transporter ATP-binding protein, partial [Ruminococcus sp.]|uniref:ABC transporter ATP-binding protein n=1 Tax=Ruminococcus sp. TaxID=41978 RepID=UPI0025E64E66
MENNILIKTEKLCKQYGEGETKLMAVNNIDLEVRKGEFVAITGESGSGKTTLLNCLGSLDRPTSGSIFVSGKDITKLDDKGLSAYRRKNIGFIFQAYNLIPVLNVEENIVLPLNLDNTPPDMEFLEELLRLTGLDKKRQNYPHELSGGQQQRVAFARALIHKPQIILADEPTGNLDSKNSREIISILKSSIKKYNQTLILITHDG